MAEHRSGNPDKSPNPRDWQKQTFKLPDNLDLSGVKPGYNVFIADRGAVGFHYPKDWRIIPDPKGAIGLHDREPPDDNCVLKVTVFRLPPVAGGWGQLPLDKLLRDSTKADRRKATPVGTMRVERRPEYELAWSELRYTDRKEKRVARSRCLLARANLIQPLITMDFWESEIDTFGPVWDEVLATLKVGVQLPAPPPVGWN